LLYDAVSYRGGVVWCDLCASQIESAVVEQLGIARKVKSSATSTTLIADSASKDEIDMRIAQVGAWGHFAQAFTRCPHVLCIHYSGATLLAV
jgi:hypothetical protein